MTTHLQSKHRAQAGPRPRHWLALALLFAATTAGTTATTAGTTAATVEASLSSSFLVRGERAMLEVVVAGAQPDRLPRLPELAGVTIQPADSGEPEPRMLERRRLGYVFKFSVLSYQVGRHRIPAITVRAGGSEFHTRPLDVEIFATDQLSWTTVRSGEETIRCASLFRVADTRPFENESIPVEMKLYVPSGLAVEDWGIPDFERDGVAVWRLEPNPMLTRDMLSRVALNGRSYTGISYPSTLTPTRSGKTSIGPARLRLITLERIPDAFGFRNIARRMWIDVPATELDARPLPPGAPEGFRNAVGHFSLTTSSDTDEVREGDPVVVTINVTGKGNLDSLPAPEPLDAPGWKAYEATTMPRGDERRALAGTIRFRQFLRPLEMQSQIPPFRLVFFDPDREQYNTALSDPIPLRILPSTRPSNAATTPPPEASMPVEHMTDILGAITAGPVGYRQRLPWHLLWHIIPATIAAALLLRIAWSKLAPRLRRNPQNTARKRDFDQLARSPKDSRTFLRAAGGFVERWLGSEIPADPRLARILADRDKLCFDPATSGKPLPAPDRRRILRTLRRHLAALAIVAPMLAATTNLRAAEPDPGIDPALPSYQEGRYAEAARLWLDQAAYHELDASHLYNLGNCWYRLGSAGRAALYYRRALDRRPGHPEALQNLRFIERKFGSLSVKRPAYQFVLARLPKSAWTNLVWTGGWLIAVGLLCFPATLPGSRIRIAAVIALVAAPVAAGLGGLGRHYYPDDARFAPPAEQAVVVADDAVLFTDASRTSAEVIDAPPGSLCRVIAERGRWTYVSFATMTRGWLPAEQVERLIPHSPPEPPTATRPTATEGST